jgi:hypothetical protein
MRWGLASSEKQIPQIIGNIENAKQGMELLEVGMVLRRQTLYPSELRALCNRYSDSKAFVAVPKI